MVGVTTAWIRISKRYIDKKRHYGKYDGAEKFSNTV
jgi:hypothetical protein